MLTRPALLTRNFPLSRAPKVISFPLSPSDPHADAAGVSPVFARLRRGKPAYAQATADRPTFAVLRRGRQSGAQAGH
jgi:hypothetical protein